MGRSSLRRHYEMKIGDEKEDRISQLSDVILHSILSFLPTKDAIRTSILSRRWQYMWTSLSDLELVESSYPSVNGRCSTHFPNFVDRVLILHDDSDIKSFYLHLCAHVDAFRLNSWVSAAVKHNCIELDLILPIGIYTLPCCLFTSESLTVFKIELSGGLLKVPTYVHLQNLKWLCLSDLTLGNNYSNLFSSCPLLEKLDIKDCEWPKVKGLTISNSSLKSLTLLLDFKFEFELMVYASSLTSFQLVSYGKNGVFILDAPSLVNAYVQVWDDNKGSPHRTIELLGGICNVKSLKLHDATLQDIAIVENFIVHLPIFRNLTCLQVDGDECTYSAKTLFAFMQKTPMLETLSIVEVPDSLFDSVEDLLILEVLPCCLRSKLKIFIMSTFLHTECEMHFLELVLKAATVLEMVKIEFACWLSEEEKRLVLVRKEVELLPRCSENCVIIFA